MNNSRARNIPAAPYSGAQQANKIKMQVQDLENKARARPKLVTSPQANHPGRIAEKYNRAVINQKMQEVKDELLKYVVTVQDAPDVIALKQSLFKLATVITRVLDILK